MKIFGYTISKNEDESNLVKNTINLPEENFNGTATDITPITGSFYQFGSTLETEATLDEYSLITKYRELSQQPEIEKAVNNIVNDIFSYDDNALPVSINLDEVEKLSEATKKKIRTEFEEILRMLNFRNDAYDIFRRWYVDGRIYYHKVMDEKNPSKGIQQLKYIDPRKIKKVRAKVDQRNETRESIDVNVRYKEFYVYNPNGVNSDTAKGLPITLDSITYVHSGILSKDNKIVYSNLHKAIRYYNSLRNLEDAVVIYRLSRAAEKRVFNVEVGDLPTNVAETYLQKVINKFRKKLSYNQHTGEVIEQKRFMTMMEDFWFPKRDGKGTTVDVLSSGQNLGEMEDVEYFKKKLYEALSVPISRLDPNSMFTLGRSTEISREELNFQKFIFRLRKRFSYLFDDILKTQLISKRILTDKEWKDVCNDISYDFLEDNHFTELKESEILQNRMNTMQSIENYVGTYISRKTVQKTIWRMTEDEIEEEKKQIEIEKEEAADEEEDVPEGDGAGAPALPKPVPVILHKPDDAAEDE